MSTNKQKLLTRFRLKINLFAVQVLLAWILFVLEFFFTFFVLVVMTFIGYSKKYLST